MKRILIFPILLLTALTGLSYGDDDHPCRSEPNEIAQRCCLLEIELRQIQREISSARESSGSGGQYLELQKEHDRIEARLSLLSGLDSLARDYREFRQRLTSPTDIGAPLANLVESVKNDGELIARMSAVHSALEELGANEALRNSQTTEELHAQLDTLCSARDLGSRADTLCRTLGLKGWSLTSRTTRFPDSQAFIGSFLEAYTISLSGVNDDAARTEQVRQYRELISDSAHAVVIDQLLEAEENHQGDRLRTGLASFNQSLSNLGTESQYVARYNSCLSQARYGIIGDASEHCGPIIADIERGLNDRRQRLLSIIEADQVLQQMVPLTISQSESLAQARQATLSNLESVSQSLASGGEDEQRLSSAISSLENRLRENLNTSLAQTPTEMLQEEFLRSNRSVANRTRNFQAMRNHANEVLSALGCDGNKSFLNATNENFTVNREKLHNCLEDHNGNFNLDEQIANLNHQKANLQSNMHQLTNTPSFRQLEAIRNFLSINLRNECTSRVSSEVLRTCHDANHGGRVQVSRLLNQAGDILAIYTADGITPSQQSTRDLNRMNDFCIQRRDDYPNACHSATSAYQARIDGDFATDTMRQFYRENHVYHDPRSGETVSRPRTSVGSMVGNALLGSTVSNLGWGLQYWQTSQALPFQYQAAINQKTMQYHQNQQMLYFQHHFFNPTSFSGYNGLGGNLYGPRPPISGMHRFQF